MNLISTGYGGMGMYPGMMGTGMGMGCGGYGGGFGGESNSLRGRRSAHAAENRLFSFAGMGGFGYGMGGEVAGCDLCLDSVIWEHHADLSRMQVIRPWDVS
jgi:hypothetical protein